MEKELIVKWNIRETETERILKLLPTLGAETRKERGNILYAVYQSEGNPNELFLHERYASQEAVEIHKNSKHYREIVIDQIIPSLDIREVTNVKRIF